MGRLKQFFMYILIGVGVYMLVSILSYAYINKAYKDIEKYEILVQNPAVEIIENKATYVNGYIIGRITNNTTGKINKTYLKIDFYNERNTYLGCEYVEINNFEQGKTLEFKTNFNFEGVNNYKVSFADYDTEAHQDTKMPPLFLLVGIIGIVLFVYWIF